MGARPHCRSCAQNSSSFFAVLCCLVDVRILVCAPFAMPSLLSPPPPPYPLFVCTKISSDSSLYPEVLSKYCPREGCCVGAWLLDRPICHKNPNQWPSHWGLLGTSPKKCSKLAVPNSPIPKQMEEWIGGNGGIKSPPTHTQHVRTFAPCGGLFSQFSPQHPHWHHLKVLSPNEFAGH